MVKRGFLKGLGGLAMGACLLAGSPAASGAEILGIDLHSSKYMSMPSDITRLAVGDPAVATVVELPGSRREFLIVTKSEGTTTLFVWTVTGERFEYLVGVSPEDTGRARIIQQAIGLPGVRVKMANKKVLLMGTVENQYERNYALRVAQLYVGGSGGGNLSVGSNADTRINAQTSSDKTIGSTGGTVGSAVREDGEVIDLLHMIHPTQIRLEAQIIAINPEDEKSLGILYGSTSGANLLTSPGIFYGGGQLSNSASPAWSGNINAALSALVTQKKAKILSRPSITTMSGEEAVIHVGGKIPYVTRDDSGKTSTDFEDYGIILQFKPVVDVENNIISSVHAEVSNMNGETSDGQPILAIRRADSVVTVASGSTMVIGGLMDSSESKAVSKIPLLGDIPVLGEFFKYTSHTRDKQELIVLVTPYLVEREESSTARMSKDLRALYDQGQKEADSREKVDLGKKEPSGEDSMEKHSSTFRDSSQDSQRVAEEAATPGEEQESLMGKYLNREVLPQKKE